MKKIKDVEEYIAFRKALTKKNVDGGGKNG